MITIYICEWGIKYNISRLQMKQILEVQQITAQVIKSSEMWLLRNVAH